jgi:small-conductance mechanosensitive channel
LIATARPDAPAALTVANREIVVLRASILGRSSVERAQVIRATVLDHLDETGSTDVSSRPLGAATIISVGGRDAFAILPADTDELAGETVEAKAALAVSRLEAALAEVMEARRPAQLAWGIGQSLVATLVFGLVVWVLQRTYRSAGDAAERAERRFSHRAIVGKISRVISLIDFLRRIVRLALSIAGILVTYVWLTFVLNRFPYSRAWGESLRDFFVGRLVWIGEGIVAAMPNVVTVALILFVARMATQFVRVIFFNVEQGRVRLPGVYTDTASMTGKLVAGLIWVMALVVAYPYVPGSSSEAFKGISVMVGLMVTLGSSGIFSQIMSGFTLTYSRALHAGDYVRVGEVEGRVSHTGLLATKIMTPERQEVTIPNAVLISQTVTNYAPLDQPPAYISTEVTIGYDAPWRQVEAMLLESARRTPGIRTEPAPVVRQSALEDFFVRYKLLISLEDPSTRPVVFDALHENIQDTFNAHGVQIMSPHYEADPAAPKLVPRAHWFTGPAGRNTPSER